MAVTDEGRARVAPAWSPAPMWALGAPAMPGRTHFVRDHFPVPAVDPLSWAVRVDGLAQLELTMDDLRARSARTLSVVLECAGHRRTEFDARTAGVPWGAGALSEAEWTGVALAELLREAGVPRHARTVVLEGADTGEFPGLAGEHAFARGLPLEKALCGDVLVAWAMNGEPIPVRRGGPVRAIVPGWYATDSIKWLARISLADRPFDGPFEALDYRFERPGATEAGSRLAELPVSSLITAPVAGARLAAGHAVVRGIAWGGEGAVAGVEVQVDGGPWRATRLTPAPGRYARTLWDCRCQLEPGRHMLCSRARDRSGAVQPLWPVPNTRGYGNNAVHRVEVDAGEEWAILGSNQ